MSAPGAASQRSTKRDFDGQKKVAPRENKAFNCELRFVPLRTVRSLQLMPAVVSIFIFAHPTYLQLLFFPILKVQLLECEELRKKGKQSASCKPKAQNASKIWLGSEVQEVIFKAHKL